MPTRLDDLIQWLETLLGASVSNSASGELQIAPASNDASFRRYFRVTGEALAGRFADAGASLIVMDAPPEKEDVQPFIAVSSLLSTAGLHVPRVLAQNLERGFLLLTDLGCQSYLDALNEQTVEGLYADALDALLRMQRDVTPQATNLPLYDDALLLNEMGLFRDWYCRKYRGFNLDTTQEKALAKVFARLSAAARAQPRVFVHRDYHSRNLMVTQRDNPGILDFQDALLGPVSYDLVSLLRDCYIAWPRARVEQWALGYLQRAADAGIMDPESNATYLRWFDWMGVQRHLKAVGIFARLHLRDDKPGYLNDIPSTLAYVREVTGRYPELKDLYHLLADLAD